MLEAERGLVARGNSQRLQVLMVLLVARRSGRELPSRNQSVANQLENCDHCQVLVAPAGFDSHLVQQRVQIASRCSDDIVRANDETIAPLAIVLGVLHREVVAVAGNAEFVLFLRHFCLLFASERNIHIAHVKIQRVGVVVHGCGVEKKVAVEDGCV